MAEVTLNINGRNYGISCDDGQERRLKDLAYYVDQRLKEISRAGAANNESHLLVLTALMLADEVFDLKDEAEELSEKASEKTELTEQELEMARTIDHLADRIGLIADRITKM